MNGVNRREAGSLLVGAGVAALVPSSGEATPPLPMVFGSRRDEVEAIRTFAEGTHPRGPEARLNPRWNELAASLAASADRLNHVEYIAALVRLMSWFEDGHTQVSTFLYGHGPFAYRLPLRIESLYDAVVVTQAHDDALPLLGTRLTHVGQTPIEEVVRRFVDVWRADNIAYNYRMLLPLFHSTGLMHGLGLMSGADDAPIRLRGVDLAGKVVSAIVRPTPAPPPAAQQHGPQVSGWPRVKRQLSARDEAAEAHPDGNFIWPLPDRKTLYVSIDTLDVSAQQFDALYLQVAEEMHRPSFDRIVVDLRRNNGGNSDHGEPLRKSLARSRFNRPGGIYVLTSPVTFSAAQNVANRIERETFALFVGEPTGGSPNHYGDAKTFQGPVTGVTIRVSSLPWFDSSPFDHREWIFPDLFVPYRYEDYMTGRDPALEAALAHVDDRPDDDRTRKYPHARASQKGGWKPFWMRS